MVYHHLRYVIDLQLTNFTHDQLSKKIRMIQGEKIKLQWKSLSKK